MPVSPLGTIKIKTESHTSLRHGGTHTEVECTHTWHDSHIVAYMHAYIRVYMCRDVYLSAYQFSP